MLRLFLMSLALLTSRVLAAPPLLPAAPELPSQAYILVDFDTGAVLVEHNADQALPPASLTKLMTAYVLAEEIDAGRLGLDDPVQVSRNAWAQNPLFSGSSLMWLEPGKPVTVRELERGIVISSGNDATMAIAEHIAGTEAAFADMMNRYADVLGLSATRFLNSHGLPAEGHQTSARDLATLAAATIRDHPDRYAVYSELSYTYNDITQYNRNTLLREDDSVDGLKTGYTSEAGYGLVASAQRDDMRLISVVLGSRSQTTRKTESRTLLNYGFRFFETLRPVLPEVPLAAERVWKGVAEELRAGVIDPVVLTVPRTSAQTNLQIAVNTPLEAPIARGDVVGHVMILRDGETLSEVPLVALEAVEQSGFFARLWDALVLWFTQLLGSA